MDYQAVRQNMVEHQIRPNRVTDAGVIAAMAEVPREMFVPEEVASIAYVDEAAPLGDNRYLMEPSLLARILQGAKISSDDVVLSIGCGTGYAAAILAKVAKAVVAVEVSSELAEKASIPVITTLHGVVEVGVVGIPDERSSEVPMVKGPAGTGIIVCCVPAGVVTTTSS